MRGDTRAPGRRPVLLAGVGALVLTAGFASLLAGVVLRVATKHSHGSLITVGAALAVAGVVLGVATLALSAFRRPRPHNDGWPGPTAPNLVTAPRSAAPNGSGQVAPPAFGTAPGYGAASGQPGYGPRPSPGPAAGGRPAPGPGGGPRPPWPQPFTASRSVASDQSQRRAAPLDPTSVYSPGGLIGPPGSAGTGRDEGPLVPGREFDSAHPVASRPSDDEYDYAEVIHEARPEPSRPHPPRPVPLMPTATPEVFVYRDADGPARPPGPGGFVGPGGPGLPGGGAAPTPDAARGPFEPLTKSPDTDGGSD